MSVGSAVDPAAVLGGSNGVATAPAGLKFRSESATLKRVGLDLLIEYPNGVRFGLAAIRDTRDGVRGELTVVDQSGKRLSWGAIALSSISTRESLRKKLEAVEPDVWWGQYLEDAAWRFTQAAREGEPLAALTGKPLSPTRELMPRLLYEGEPTLVYADGDTGKSLFALTVAVAVQAGATLPCGLRPARAVPTAILDWETSRDTVEGRIAKVAAGLGLFAAPPVLYKRMTRPLVDEAGPLAAEFSRRSIGLVVVDSQMFAMGSGEGSMIHEPLTQFYGALRLFAPSASLVLSHVTGADARSGAPARPFGGAFAFNGPRLVYEARRDRDIADAAAIAFICTKANNLARRPDPFGLRFEPDEDAITVHALDLAEAAPQATAGGAMPQRILLAVATGALTIAELAEHLNAAEDTVGRVVRRLRERGRLVPTGHVKPFRWGLPTR